MILKFIHIKVDQLNLVDSRWNLFSYLVFGTFNDISALVFLQVQVCHEKVNSNRLNDFS